MNHGKTWYENEVTKSFTEVLEICTFYKNSVYYYYCYCY